MHKVQTNYKVQQAYGFAVLLSSLSGMVKSGCQKSTTRTNRSSYCTVQTFRFLSWKCEWFLWIYKRRILQLRTLIQRSSSESFLVECMNDVSSDMRMYNFKFHWGQMKQWSRISPSTYETIYNNVVISCRKLDHWQGAQNWDKLQGQCSHLPSKVFPHLEKKKSVATVLFRLSANWINPLLG